MTKHTWLLALISKLSLLFLLILSYSPAEAKLLVKPIKAIENYFQDPDIEVNEKNILLTAKELEKHQKLSEVKSESTLYRTYHVTSKNKNYFVPIITRIVRSKNQALAVFLDDTGQVLHIEVIAFNEPPKYQPHSSLLAQFNQKSLSWLLANKKSINTISGATLTTEATKKSVRLAIALWELKVKKGKN